MPQKRVILLKTKKLAIDGVQIREYPKGELLTIRDQLADNLIKAKWAKEFRARFSKADDE